MLTSYVCCCGRSYISRFDLINWKVLVEHPRALGMDQKVHMSLILLFFAAFVVHALFFIAFVNPDSGYSPDAESKCLHSGFACLPRCVSIHAH